MCIRDRPSFEVFVNFCKMFQQISQKYSKKQYILPYLISAFPGCTDEQMYELAGWFKRKGWNPQQVQCFIPTPGTVATAMFWCGKDTQGRKIFVARTDAERLRQHYILISNKY